MSQIKVNKNTDVTKQKASCFRSVTKWSVQSNIPSDDSYKDIVCLVVAVIMCNHKAWDAFSSSCLLTVTILRSVIWKRKALACLNKFIKIDINRRRRAIRRIQYKHTLCQSIFLENLFCILNYIIRYSKQNCAWVPLRLKDCTHPGKKNGINKKSNNCTTKTIKKMSCTLAHVEPHPE